jgi:hypothetical protein
MNLADVTTKGLLSEFVRIGGYDGYQNDEMAESELEDYIEDEDSEFFGWDALGDMFYHRQWDSETLTMVDREIPKVFGFDFEIVEDFGGEGQGDSRHVVFSLTDGTNTRYFRKDGFYASYDGSTWDGEFREVMPIDRVVTFYE